MSRPGLVFDHGKHLGVTCEACHVAQPHADGGTSFVPMDLCFNCHGVQHGPSGELASGQCLSCHVSTFPLRPKSHTKDWKLRPHADVSKAGGTNRCLMCHDPVKDCDGCHRKEHVITQRVGTVYHPVWPKQPRRSPVRVFPEGKVTIGQCVDCHPDVDDFLPGRVIFQHATHIMRDYTCEACHGNGGHGLEGVRRPDMQTCYQCHGLTHSVSGIVATTNCSACHPKNFKLTPSDHTKAFIASKHSIRAKADAAYCAMCHKLDFCVKCHRGRTKLANGGTSATVIPAAHKRAEWQRQHGAGYLNGQGLCGACHDGVDCVACHRTQMPHPSTWLASHADSGIDRQDCNVCHTDRTACQNCHHSSVKLANLVREACVGCHKEFKTNKPTAIKNKALAEHAVHFNVAKKKGKPYACYDCHVDFGSSTVEQKASQQQAHDLRLCYSCHGNLDYKNMVIAPWPGADLCRRCHTDLNI